MTSIAQKQADRQEDIPFETGEITRRARSEPICTPLTDLMAASYRDHHDPSLAWVVEWDQAPEVTETGEAVVEWYR